MKTPSTTPAGSHLGKHLRTRLMSGLLVLVPLAITLFILRVIVSFLAAFVLPLVRPWLGCLPEQALTAVALLVTTLLIYLTGLITAHIVGRRVIHWGERLLLKLPLVRPIYAASKQVVETFSSSTQAAFQAVVLVEFPRQGSLAVGFVTGTILSPEGKMLYRVFVATTPNPTSGFLVLLPGSEVHFTDISVEDGVKMIVSGGMLAPASFQVRPPPDLG